MNNKSFGDIFEQIFDLSEGSIEIIEDDEYQVLNARLKFDAKHYKKGQFVELIIVNLENSSLSIYEQDDISDEPIEVLKLELNVNALAD